jgi:hypothetical protein
LPADYSKRKVCPQLLSENCTDSLFWLLGILGLKIPRFQIIGLFKPIYRQARRSDMNRPKKCCISCTKLYD